jgi:oligopeptide transport system permease protein
MADPDDRDDAPDELPLLSPYAAAPTRRERLLDSSGAWILAAMTGLIAAWMVFFGTASATAEAPPESFGWLIFRTAATFSAVALLTRWALTLPYSLRVLAWALGLWLAWKTWEAMAGDFSLGFRIVFAGAILAGMILWGERLLARPEPLLKNFAIFAFVVWLIATITFFLAQAIPGGPFTQERSLPPHVKEALERRYNLNAPVSEQYQNYIKNLARFDLGPSYYQQGRTVNEIIARGFPNSLKIGVWALLLSLAIGLPMGVCAALWQNRWQDYLALGIVVFGVSVPSFIFGGFEQYLFAYKWRLLPASGLDSWREYIMPSLALATLPGAFVIRLIRSEMIDVLGAQYIAAARARGLSAFSVVWKHALRNALLAVVTYLGPIAAALFTGSFVIEKIFDIPGLGREYVTAISNRDYNLILGTTIFYAGLLVGLNMLIDSLYKVIDPRVSEGDAS